MEVPVSVHLEAISETTFGHLKHCVFDSLKFALDLLVLGWEVAECTEYLESIVFSTLQGKPARRLRETRDESDNDEREYDLESDGKSPGYGRGFEEGEAKVNPVA